MVTITSIMLQREGVHTGIMNAFVKHKVSFDYNACNDKIFVREKKEDVEAVLRKERVAWNHYKLAEIYV